jgi:DNA topoisomerase-1
MPFIKRAASGGSAAGNGKPVFKKKAAVPASSAKSGRGKTLIIVESPAKCNKIEGYLGRDNYICMASYGHVREIEDGLKSIDINNEFETKFTIMKSKWQQVAKLRAVMTDCCEVILATDDDREGEAIAWHLCEVLKLPVATTKRIIFHEITENALKAAVISPRTIDMSIVHAQQARQILDLVVGYKVSPVLWTYIARTNLSAGRCQTPALRLVYENYKELESSPGVMVYSVAGIFTKLNLIFNLSIDLESTNEVERLLKETSEAPDSAFKASLSVPKKSTRTQPRPYSTSTLQQAANNEIHISPKDTMYAAQKLYEQGYITYMRTDSKVYSIDFVKKTFEYIKNRWGGAVSSSDDTDMVHLLGNIKAITASSSSSSSGGAEVPAAAAAHEAIRPTDINRVLLPQSCHPREHRLYAMIWRNTLESCMAVATCQTITMAIQSPYTRTPAEYRYTAEQVIHPGWKLVAGYDKEAKEYTYFASLSSTISSAAQQQIFPYKKITTKCSMRNTKSHYTEAGLVQILEKMEIGRPSTFSSLIDKIQEREYVKVQDVRGKSIECIEYILQSDKKIEKKIEVREVGGEHRKLVIQPLGIMVIEFLMEHFAPLFDYEFTKQMEFQLDEIATDGMIWHELCYNCWHEVSNQLQELKTRGVVKEEIRIDDNHTYIIGKFGPVIKCVVSNPIHKSIEHTDDDDVGGDDAGSDDDAGDGGSGKQVVIFKPVRKDLDYSKILRGEYTLEYMIGTENTVASDDTTNKTCGGGGDGVVGVSGRCLGQYQGNNIFIKSGKYGPYVNWGSQNLSLKALLGTYSSKNNKFARKETKQTKSEFDLTLQDVIEFIRGQKSNNADDSVAAVNNDSEPGCAAAPPTTTQSQIVRVIDDNSSIRNGRFGPYIFYKTPKMSKPDFIPLKGFAQKNGDYAKCDIAILKEWIIASSSTKKK